MSRLKNISIWVLSTLLIIECLGCLHSRNSENETGAKSGYIVEGEVHITGFVPCAGNPKTLGELIAISGGFKDLAYLKKIDIVQNNHTNVINFAEIQKTGGQDPIIPCGSKIVVRRRVY